MAFVAKLRHNVRREGNKEFPMYLDPTGIPTDQKSKARQFTSEDELNNFLRNLPKNEGKVPECDMEPA